jgi:K+-sensing histidine kinase KdpD
MKTGYQLIKEQLFFQKELVERAYWLINLRWVVTGAALVAGWIGHFLDFKHPIVSLTILFLFVALNNAAFSLIWRRLSTRERPEVRHYAIFAHVQITFDLLVLFCVIYLTGGISSPLLIFVIFHIILAGILLAPVSCFVYAGLILLGTAALILLQESSILPPQPVLFQSLLFPSTQSLPNVLALYITFASAIVLTAFLVTTLKSSLRAKSKSLLAVSKELDASNTKLTALYEMIKEMELCTEFQDLIDSATRNAARIMGVKGCSIKLLDDQRKRLTFASTHGLSEDYKAKGAIDIDKSPINRKILQGSFFTIGKINKSDYFQYPEDVRKEGIASMMCLPLRVEKMIFGVFCVYSDIDHYFGPDDVNFFSLMADLTAIVIENLKRELNKTWFLKKAAHQLRSPIGAVQSMLELILKGYQGDVDDQQRETLTRCRKRLAVLGEVINDLLKLGLKRISTGETTYHPVGAGEILKSLEDLYRPRASEKGVDMTFRVDDPLPQVMAEEKMIDDLFANLVSNAIKYTPSGGTVAVTLCPEAANRIRFEVADTGIGIPESELPHLFSEFFRAENAKAFSEEGTGLGLVIVKEIVDRLKGTISVESREGEGTRFTCLLPGAKDLEVRSRTTSDKQ